MLETPLKTPQHSIKTFAYQSLSSFHKSYKSWLTIYRNKKGLWDTVKISVLSLGVLFFGGLFLYYINLASTRGYFMKVETWKLENIKAKSDIVKLEVIRKKRANRDNLYTPRHFDLQKNLIPIEIPELEQEED